MKKRVIAAVALVTMVGSAVQAASFYPIKSVASDTAGTDFYPATRLIEGPGFGFDASAPHNRTSSLTWVTNAPNGGNGDYFAPTPTPSPRLVFDMGTNVTLSEISVWGYANTNANGANDFSLRFATEADGPGGMNTSIALNPTYTAIQNVTPRQSFSFGQDVQARYVELVPLDNFFGITPPGGDRVGLGEVAFQAPDPPEPVGTTNLSLGKEYAYSNLPSYPNGGHYFDDPHVQTVDVFDTGDLTDGVLQSGAPGGANQPVVGWYPVSESAEIIFDLGAEFLVSQVILGTHTYNSPDNGAADSAVVSFSTTGTAPGDFGSAVTNWFRREHVLGDGHHDLPTIGIPNTSARYVKVAFDGGGVLGGGNHPPNKWMLDEITILGSTAPPVIPEPMTMLAVGISVAGLGGYIRKRNVPSGRRRL